MGILSWELLPPRETKLYTHIFHVLYSECNSMEIGGLISTNNMIDDGVKQVTVDTTHTLLWTMSHKLADSEG